ncbi:MAG: universal stress protein [Thiothrix sp.]|uniref:universal stress protein n=1 Tax=Thiothrix sp. TaxID=1032 RepID=UPI00261C7BE0|nr:universal stress protein [Thiothrix sp.]MDD5395459.1 universal stress protein [Thiothrix sp.]
MTSQVSLAVAEEFQPSLSAHLHQRILVALDSSDHANAAMRSAVELAELTSDSVITGAHVYAAKLHDMRFRQMEGGLPEQFKQEQELERQRDVHDDLITRGLSIITDSYLDQAATECDQLGINFKRCSLEGKNYRELTRETNSGVYDLLVMGALGLGAIKGSRLGTVCDRVARRSVIDTLIIKEPDRSIVDGPIVVAIDGSSKAYGGLLTALALAKHWQVSVKVIAAFDPYYHYVAFNRIAGVLSEEAGKVFKFKDQEKLHEEIIDSGLAKIYDGHLIVARSIAEDFGVEIETELLDGKPHDAIEKYVKKVKPSLLVVGKLGIHADDELDIGGNSEHLLQNVDCSILLSMREHQPEVDVVSEVTTSWTHEAEIRMERVPSFVRNMARMAILRYAQQHGHTVITQRIVEEATAQLMPNHAEQAMGEIVAAYDAGELKRKPAAEEVMRWSDEAVALLRTVEDLSVRGNLSMRAEKKARQEKSAAVEASHIQSFLDAATSADTQPSAPSEFHWQVAALARLMRVPEGFMRDNCKQSIEKFAQQNGHAEISLEVAENGLKLARGEMEKTMQQQSAPAPKAARGGCPFGFGKKASAADNSALPWNSEAEQIMQGLPEGMSRDMTRNAIVSIAAKNGVNEITADVVRQVLDTFKSGSNKVNETMPWDEDARDSLSRAPDMVRGMLIKEVENWAQHNNRSHVDLATVSTVKQEWQSKGYFHMNPEDPRSKPSL